MRMILIPDKGVERINEVMYVRMHTHHMTCMVETAKWATRSVLFLPWHRITTGKQLPKQRLQFPWLLASGYTMI